MIILSLWFYSSNERSQFWIVHSPFLLVFLNFKASRHANVIRYRPNQVLFKWGSYLIHFEYSKQVALLNSISGELWNRWDSDSLRLKTSPSRHASHWRNTEFGLVLLSFCNATNRSCMDLFLFRLTSRPEDILFEPQNCLIGNSSDAHSESEFQMIDIQVLFSKNSILCRISPSGQGLIGMSEGKRSEISIQTRIGIEFQVTTYSPSAKRLWRQNIFKLQWPIAKTRLSRVEKNTIDLKACLKRL